jgi:endonuclease NucS-like protein
MTERDMEDLIAAYPDDFFPREPLVLVGRQQSLDGVGRFDLLFEDRFKSKILMELKARPLKYEDATQVANYRDELKRNGCKNVWMWLVAPRIPDSVSEFLDDIGIMYTEIHFGEFRRVAERHDSVIKSDRRPPKAQVAAAERVPETTDPSGDGSFKGVGIHEIAGHLGPKWTVRDLAQALKVHRSNAQRRLTKWAVLGKVEKISPSKLGRAGSPPLYRFVETIP